MGDLGAVACYALPGASTLHPGVRPARCAAHVLALERLLRLFHVGHYRSIAIDTDLHVAENGRIDYIFACFQLPRELCLGDEVPIGTDQREIVGEQPVIDGGILFDPSLIQCISSFLSCCSTL
jgi:hypothetical protein